MGQINMSCPPPDALCQFRECWEITKDLKGCQTRIDTGCPGSFICGKKSHMRKIPNKKLLFDEYLQFMSIPEEVYQILLRQFEYIVTAEEQIKRLRRGERSNDVT